MLRAKRRICPSSTTLLLNQRRRRRAMMRKLNSSISSTPRPWTGQDGPMAYIISAWRCSVHGPMQYSSFATRSYPLPPPLSGKRIAILETPQGKAGVSTLGNHVDFQDATTTRGAKIVGWCKFSSIKVYTNRRDFEQDEKAHQVCKSSGFGWNEVKTPVIYGWIVGECQIAENGESAYMSGTRRLRSLYQLFARIGETFEDTKPLAQSRERKLEKASHSGGKKKKKRRF